MRQRRKKRTIRSRVRQSFFFLTFFGLVFGWAGTYAATWHGFRAKSIPITGTRVVSQKDVRAAANIDPDANIWLLNPWAIARKIEAIPYIETARIHRRLPNIMSIEVTERRPESCVEGAQNTMMLIDATQRVLDMGCTVSLIYEVPKMPVHRPGTTLDDPHFERLRAVAAMLAGVEMRIKRLSFDRDEGVVVDRADGVRLLFGDDDDVMKKIRLVAPILAAARSHDPDVEMIDVRAVDTPVVRYREIEHGTQNPLPK